MADNRDDILIRIRAQTSEAVRGLKGLAAAATAAIASFVVQNIVRFTQAMVKLGLEFDRLRTRAELTAGSAQILDAHIRAIRESTDNAVDTTTAMNFALQAMQFGLAGTPEQMGELAKNILIVSDGNLELADSFLYMLSNGITSMERLNEFGLDQVKVRNRVKELGEEMQGTSRDELFMIAVMEELDAKASQLGGTLESTAAQVAKGAAVMAEAKSDASEFFAVFNDGVALLAGIVDQKLSTAFDRLIQEQFPALLAQGAQLENLFMVMSAASSTYGMVLSELRTGQLEFNQIGERSAELFDRYVVAFGGISTEASRAEEAMAAVSATAEEGAPSLQMYADGMEKVAKATGGAKEKLDEFSKSSTSLTGGSLTGLLDALSSAVDSEVGALQGGIGIETSSDDIRTQLAEALVSEMRRRGVSEFVILDFMVAVGIADPAHVAMARELAKVAQAAMNGATGSELAALFDTALSGGTVSVPGAVGGGGKVGATSSPNGTSSFNSGNSFGGQGGDQKVHVEINVSKDADRLIEAKVVRAVGTPVGGSTPSPNMAV